MLFDFIGHKKIALLMTQKIQKFCIIPQVKKFQNLQIHKNNWKKNKVKNGHRVKIVM